jgi:hypothetical protein
MSNLERLTSPLISGVTSNFNVSLGTSVTAVTFPPAPLGAAVQVKIVNASTTATIAYAIGRVGATAPVITATPGASDCGSLMLVSDKEYFAINPNAQTLHVVASAAGTAVSITFAVSEN